MQTNVSSFEYSADEYNIVAMPSPETVAVIGSIQRQLKGLFGDAIWLMQPRSLHITVMEIICNTDYKGQVRRHLFEQWYKQYHTVVAEVLASCQPLKLHFSELVVSPGAIIVKTQSSEQLNAVRNALLARIALPDGTKVPPDITHCSIARYSQSIDLDKAQRAAQHISVDADEMVDQFKLMNNLVPPDFNPNCLETYSLAK
jgi:hypothetical protein